MSDELILHHYDTSPFSEKVRVVLGLKDLPWRSVLIPNIMPKPDLIPLTGGYRRTPVMQIGADIFCDTQVILAEIERRAPMPAMSEGAGLAGQLLGRPAVLRNHRADHLRGARRLGARGLHQGP